MHSLTSPFKSKENFSVDSFVEWMLTGEKSPSHSTCPLIAESQRRSRCRNGHTANYFNCLSNWQGQGADQSLQNRFSKCLIGKMKLLNPTKWSGFILSYYRPYRSIQLSYVPSTKFKNLLLYNQPRILSHQYPILNHCHAMREIC